MPPLMARYWYLPVLFLSGTPPIVQGKFAFTGRRGESLSVEQGREAARLAALNALALAQAHLGGLDRVKRAVKLTVLMVTTEQFVEHASLGDGASNLFSQLFGPETGHVRVVYGVQTVVNCPADDDMGFLPPAGLGPQGVAP